MGEPSGSVATRTREGYGCPVSRSRVARDAYRAVRTSRRVVTPGSTGVASCVWASGLAAMLIVHLRVGPRVCEVVIIG